MAGISVTMLGTGAWIGDTKNKWFGPCILLQVGGKRVLIDAPGGVNYQLAKAGIGANQIDCIFLTHHHADHTSGLVQLIGEMHITKRKTPLTMVSADCGRFFRAIVRPYQKLFGSLREFSDFRMKFVEIENARDAEGAPATEIKGLGLGARIFARRLEHSKNYADYGYRFEAGGKSVTVTGDTEYCDALVGLVSGTDLAICECSHVQKIPGHLSAYEFKALSLFAKRLVPYHMYPGWDAKKEFKEFGNIHVAKDLEKFRV